MWSEILCINNTDFTMLPKLVWEKFHIVCCRAVLIVAAKKTHFNATLHQMVFKNSMYFLSFIENKQIRFSTWINRDMNGLSISLITSDFTPRWKKNINFFATWSLDWCLLVKTAEISWKIISKCPDSLKNGLMKTEVQKYSAT